MSWQEVAEQAAGWLDPVEGEALREHALSVAHLGPLLEIGGYAGKSACWLGSVAQEHDTVLFSVDWHRGSPEMAPDRECHDPQMVGPDGFDTLPHFRRNIAQADLEPWVIPVVGASPTVGRWWQTPLALLFIDGAHDSVGVRSDYDLWAGHVLPGGRLIFHDATIPGIGRVADQAVTDGFELLEQVGCMRVLAR